MTEMPPDDVLARWDATLDTAEWVTLQEAAAAAGVSVSALRSWYRAGDVGSRMERGPHGQQRLVRLEDVLERAARSRRPGGPPAAAGARPSSAAEAPAAPTTAVDVGDVIAVLRDHLARADERSDRAEAALRACEGELRAALERAAAAEAERDVLRRLLDRPGA